MYAKAGILMAATIFSTGALGEERQLTFSPKNHNLDQNDNFSPDQRFLCFDTRETIGPGIDHGQTIEKVEISTGAESLIYKPAAVLTGTRSAPGIGAVSYSPVADSVIFIHGPLVEEVDVRGPYGKPNRKGALVPGDGSGTLSWADFRDIAKDRDTLAGAHRGGTHRHEYSLDGKRIGFTYDDFLMPEYDRTIGYMEPREDAPGDASHYFALLVAVPPMGKSKPGEIEKAAADSWVGREGRMRAFIGKVRAQDGVAYEESLFVVDIPEGVDITTADAGSAMRFPSPPQGVKVRRLTHDWAGGIVRGSYDGSRIAYYGKDANGVRQVFLIASDGSDRSDQPEKRPVQATFLEKGAEASLRWHPSGHSILCVSNNGIVSTCVVPGPRFGKSVFLTPQGDQPVERKVPESTISPWPWMEDSFLRSDVVISPDGKTMAYSKAVPTKTGKGEPAHTYAGKDFHQIFVSPFPDADNDGIADGTPE